MNRLEHEGSRSKRINGCIGSENTTGKPNASGWKQMLAGIQSRTFHPHPFVDAHDMKMKPILHSFAYCLDFLREQVADVSAADRVAQPNGIMNHPAWVIGHLTVTCQELGGAIGLPPWLQDDWGRRFGAGSVPVADANLYETKEIALANLRDAQSRIMHAVESLEDSRLDEPFPAESYRIVFPSIRHAITQVLVGHPAYHIGQLAVWRRSMGMPPIGRSFE